MLWQHVAQIYFEDLDNGLKLLPKLTQDYINLTPYSKMTVKYEVQVLSNTVSKVINEFGPEGTKETAKLFELAIVSLSEGENEKKTFSTTLHIT